MSRISVESKTFLARGGALRFEGGDCVRPFLPFTAILAYLAWHWDIYKLVVIMN